MASLEEDLINGISSLPPEHVAMIDRWIDSDPQAVQILVGAVPALRPMLEPFINGDGAGTAPSQGPQAPQTQPQQAPAGMSGAQLLTSIAGR